MKGLKIALLWMGVVFILLQFIQIEVPEPPKAKPGDEISAPAEIMSMLKRSCYDCHSNHIDWPWYSHIAPVSFEVRAHVRDGRKWLNFSIWNQYDQKKKQKHLKGIVKSITIKMPMPSYLITHEEARLTYKERNTIKKWAQDQVIE